MDHTTLRGRIVSWYEERKGDHNRSREDFTITKHTDGLRVLRSFCQLYDNGIIRDVVLAMDEDYSPRDASIRVMVDDSTQGTAWYRFTGDSIECEAMTDAGRISQRASRNATSATLGTHALQSDAWMLAKLDYTQPGLHSLDNIPFCSSHHLGATGPHLEFVGGASSTWATRRSRSAREPSRATTSGSSKPRTTTPRTTCGCRPTATTCS